MKLLWSSELAPGAPDVEDTGDGRRPCADFSAWRRQRGQLLMLRAKRLDLVGFLIILKPLDAIAEPVAMQMFNPRQNYYDPNGANALSLLFQHIWRFPEAAMQNSAEEHPREKAERLEQEARDAIPEYRLEQAIELLREALSIREACQGESHPDLIWTLSIWIEALRWEHRFETAREVARLGERRLALRRAALAGARDELAYSLSELMTLYTFEDEVFDPRRMEELRRELATLAGAQEEGGA